MYPVHFRSYTGIFLPPGRAVGYTDNCWEEVVNLEKRPGYMHIHMSEEHVTTIRLCNHLLEIFTVNPSGKAHPLKCPHMGQTSSAGLPRRPERGMGQVKNTFFWRGGGESFPPTGL